MGYQIISNKHIRRNALYLLLPTALFSLTLLVFFISPKERSEHERPKLDIEIPHNKTYGNVLILKVYRLNAISKGAVIIGCKLVGTETEIPCPDYILFNEDVRFPVMANFGKNKYKELEDKYSSWCTGNDRFADGRWKLSFYGNALYAEFKAREKWTEYLESIKNWQKQFPDSEAAHYAEAIYWRAYAWQGRGGKFAKDVSKESWALFKQRLIKANDILNKMHSSGFKCAAPYAIWISVIHELSSDNKKLMSAYEEGSSRFPEYHPIHFAFSYTVSPKWGGNKAAYEKFADQVAASTKNFEGMGMYARLYWIVDNKSDIPFTGKAGTTPVWKKLRQGYEDLMERYPDSAHNLKQYVDITCRSQDSELYKGLRTTLNNTGLVESDVDYEACDIRHDWSRPNS